MSVAVQYPSNSDLIPNNPWPSINMFGAAVLSSGLSSGGCGLVRSESATRLKTLSRSREASPGGDIIGRKGYSRLNSGSGKNSPATMSPCMTRLQVAHAASLGNTLLKSDNCSSPISASNVCDKIKKLSISHSQGINPEELAACPNVLLLDCRPFIAYNMVHIKGALSVNCCDRLTKKRLNCGKIQLVDIISGTDAKEEYNRKIGKSELVVYDEETSDPDSGERTALKLVINILQKDGHEVLHLKGGLSNFQKTHGEHCVRPDYKPPPKLLYSPTTPSVFDDQIDTATVSEILPFLYIGNARDAANLDILKENGITHVMNVTSHIPLHFEAQGITYKRLPASDSGNQNLKQYFNDAFIFIEEACKSGGKVLVHCEAGVSRSATMTIFYLMKRSTMSMLEAFRFVKSKRSIVAPNFNFMGQLYELEQLLNEGKVPRQMEPALQLCNVHLH